MSVLNQFHPEEAIINKKDLMIWNNEAFDNGGDDDDSNNLMKKSVSSIKDSFDSSFSSKENQSPSGFTSKSGSTVHVHQSKPLKNLPIKIVFSNLEEKTDEEIEIENEIRRLYARLESLRDKRADQNAKNLENGGRTVDSGVKKIEKESGFSRTNNLEKMVDSGVKKIEKESGFSRTKNLEKMVDSGVKKFEKESGFSRTKNLEKMVDSGVKKIEKESGFSRTKIIQRSFSLGPNEIISERNPKSKQSGTTPIQSTQNRRKSCFWKLEEIEEEKMGFSRINNPNLRQAFTTGGVKKGTKKDDSILSSIQPKKLFGEQSVSAKKPLKPGRVIASRYNQATVTSSMRKKSLTENNIKSRGPTTEGRVKRKWEIPSEILIPKRLELDSNENEIEVGSIDVVMNDVLPRIRAVRCVDETGGRDSGPAKRVAELVGKKSYFHQDEEEEEVCQRLSFEEEEEEE